MDRKFSVVSLAQVSHLHRPLERLLRTLAEEALVAERVPVGGQPTLVSRPKRYRFGPALGFSPALGFVFSRLPVCWGARTVTLDQSTLDTPPAR